MSPDTFNVFLERLKDTSLPIKSVQLNGQGEPLLHNQFTVMARKLKEGFPSLSLHAITNGSVYRHIPEELDYFEVSVNAGNKESYKRITGLNWERTLEHIAIWRGDLRLQVHMLVFDENCTEVPEFTKAFTGIKQVLSYKFDNQCGEIEDKTLSEYKKEERIPCDYITDMLFITWTGDVLMCPHDVHGEVPLGNICQDSLESIWNGETHQRLLKEHQERRFTSICTNCNYNV